MKLQACSFTKIETLAQVFSCGIGRISKNDFFYRTRVRATASLYRAIASSYASYILKTSSNKVTHFLLKNGKVTIFLISLASNLFQE